MGIARNIIIDYQPEELIKSELDNLDDVTRDVIVLRTWDELNFREISSVIKLGENTTKAIYCRGLEKVKKQLEGKQPVKVRAFTLPIILTGILQYGKFGNFLPSTNTVTKVFNILQKSNLLLSTNIMDNASNIANTASSVGADAAGSIGLAGSIGATSVAAGTVAKTTFLGTTLGKVIIGVVTTTAVVGGGVGGYIIVNESKDETPSDQQVVSYPTDNVTDDDSDGTGTGAAGSTIPVDWELLVRSACPIAVEIPPQDTYEPAAFTLGTDDPNNGTMRWSVKDYDQPLGALGFSDTASVFVAYTPNGYDRTQIPCGAGCVEETVITISCADSSNDLDALLAEIRSKLDDMNQDYATAMGEDTYLRKILNSEKVTRWGVDVYKLTTTTGPDDPRTEFYLTMKDGKAYLISQYGDAPNSQLIVENLQLGIAGSSI